MIELNTNEMHEANRKWWDVSSPDRKKQDEEYWQECAGNPSLAFEGNMLEIINKFVGDLTGKSVCIIGRCDTRRLLHFHTAYDWKLVVSICNVKGR